MQHLVAAEVFGVNSAECQQLFVEACKNGKTTPVVDMLTDGLPCTSEYDGLSAMATCLDALDTKLSEKTVAPRLSVLALLLLVDAPLSDDDLLKITTTKAGPVCVCLWSTFVKASLLDLHAPIPSVIAERDGLPEGATWLAWAHWHDTHHSTQSLTFSRRFLVHETLHVLQDRDDLVAQSSNAVQHKPCLSLASSCHRFNALWLHTLVGFSKTSKKPTAWLFD